MKRQDHLLVPRLEHGPAWALLVSLLLGTALFFVQQRMPAPFVEIEDFRRFLLDRRPLPNLRWLDWVVAVHLVFTLSCSLLPKGTVAWRKGDAPRTLYCFRAPPPRFSWWLAGLALVTYLAPFLYALPESQYQARELHPTLGFLGALHGAGLMVLVSASLWCWVAWLLGLRRVRLGETPSAGSRWVLQLLGSPSVLRLTRYLGVRLRHRSSADPSFLGTGSALFIEQEGHVDLVRVFGLADRGAWDPRRFLVDERDQEYIATYRQARAAAEPERDFDCYVPKEPGSDDKLALPFSLDVWLWVCMATALVALVLVFIGHWALGAATVIPGGCIGFLLRDKSTSDPLASALNRWHWHQEGWFPPAMLMVSGFCAWNGLANNLAGPGYSIAPWYEAMALVVPLWLPFWLSFVEPRIFVRLRDGRLEFRRLGLWLPITFAYAESPRVLVLCCGPFRLGLNLVHWRGHPWHAADLAARMQPYLAYWEPKPEAAQEEEARAAEG